MESSVPSSFSLSLKNESTFLRGKQLSEKFS